MMRVLVSDRPNDMLHEETVRYDGAAHAAPVAGEPLSGTVKNEGKSGKVRAVCRIDVDRTRRYQSMDGFGASFTDSSAYLIDKVLEPQVRDRVMHDLFDPVDGIGLSALRNPMGASDYARTVYSYDDMPIASSDPQLQRFSIAHDLESILPLTRQAMLLNPDLKLMTSPWSAPGWMKTSHSMRGGTLRRKYFPAYAQYFVRFIQEYATHGVPVYAVSVQNEPLYMPLHYPSMLMPASQEAEFVRDHLAPAFRDAGVRTKILGYDHNWDCPEYADELLDKAPGCFDGIAWHWYAGSPEAQDDVMWRHPGTDMYFSEGSGGSWIPEFEPAFSNMMRMAIGALNHGAKTFILWNMALDEHNGPTVPGFGRSTCRGLLRVDTASRSCERTLDYYGLAHFSRFVRSGAVRIGSTVSAGGPPASDEHDGEVRSVAFENADGSLACVLFNDSSQSISVQVSMMGELVEIPLTGHAACTVVWDRRN